MTQPVKTEENIMKVSDYLNENFCAMEIKSQDKEGIIKEIIQKLVPGDKIIDQEVFIKDVLEREALGSTAIGNNVAIPHARTDAVKGFVIGFGRSVQGVDFKSLDGAKVNLIFLMGADPSELSLYLRLLAELSKLLMNSAFRKELILANTAGEVIQIIKRFER
jgi:fructose-specific phosphotransferase system IIA component